MRHRQRLDRWWMRWFAVVGVVLALSGILPTCAVPAAAGGDAAAVGIFTDESPIAPPRVAAPGGAGAAALAVAAVPASPPVVLVVASDLHVQKSNLAMLRKAVGRVNAMADVAAVAILGDICQETGSPAEFERAMALIREFRAPVLAIPGNHDYLYRDRLDADGDKQRGSAAEKAAKLERYRQAFKLPQLRFTRRAAGYLLVFLPTDALDGRSIATVSEETLSWLRQTLAANRRVPTIIFAHAPLEGSYDDPDAKLAPFHACTQPAAAVRAILREHAQVFAWVAGHRHTTPKSKNYLAPVNRVDRVTVVHVGNITGDHGWIQRFELTPAAVTVRTIDVETGKIVSKLDRWLPNPFAAWPGPGGTSGAGGQPGAPGGATGAGGSAGGSVGDAIRSDWDHLILSAGRWVGEMRDLVRRLFSF